jgi:hypothetical protein
MYAVIEKDYIKISVAEFYSMGWYERDQFLSMRDAHEFDYGHLEIDIHRNGKKYLTGFAFDPRAFIVDYLKTRYKKDFETPKRIQCVRLDTGKHTEMFSVDFLKTRSFVIEEMEKDLIFPQFCKSKGDLTIQGFEVLDVFFMIRYLARRFKYKGTSYIRQGDRFYDMKTKRWRGIRLGEKRKR